MTRRTEKIEVRVSTDELERIKARADQRGMKLSEWMRAAGQADGGYAEARRMRARAMKREKIEAEVGTADLDESRTSRGLRNQPRGGVDSSPDQEPASLTAREWDREVKRHYNRGATTPQARQAVTRQYGPRPKEKK